MILLIGGLLGILFVILLRRTLVVDADLPFPESYACYEIVRAGKRERVVPVRIRCSRSGDGDRISQEWQRLDSGSRNLRVLSAVSQVGGPSLLPFPGAHGKCRAHGWSARRDAGGEPGADRRRFHHRPSCPRSTSRAGCWPGSCSSPWPFFSIHTGSAVGRLVSSPSGPIWPIPSGTTMSAPSRSAPCW